MFGEYYGRPARTIDAGRHWALERLPRSSFAGRFVIAPGNDRIVYTGGYGGIVPGGPPGGIFRSDDQGVTWRKIAPYEPNELVVDPSASETIYVTTEQGLYKSSDGGQHWAELIKGLPRPGARPEWFGVLALSASVPSTLYVDAAIGKIVAGNHLGGSLHVIARSPDGGLSWKSTTLTLLGVDDILIDPTSRMADATPDPSFRQTLLAGLSKTPATRPRSRLRLASCGEDRVVRIAIPKDEEVVLVEHNAVSRSCRRNVGADDVWSPTFHAHKAPGGRCRNAKAVSDAAGVDVAGGCCRSVVRARGATSDERQGKQREERKH